MNKAGAIPKRVGLLALALLAAIACSPKPTMVHIKNATGTDLKEVVLSGSGFQVAVPDIRAGGVVDVAVVSRGESGLRIWLLADGRRVSLPEQGYFEAGGNYKGNVLIKPDLSVSVEFRLATYTRVNAQH